MPELDLEPKSYRAMSPPPKASRLNAILVLIVCLLFSPFLVLVWVKDQTLGFGVSLAVVIGMAMGWAITRINDPKPYIPEDDPHQLKNPAPKTFIDRALARPAGWDAPGKWLSRLIAAIVMGLGVYFVRQWFGPHR